MAVVQETIPLVALGPQPVIPPFPAIPDTEECKTLDPKLPVRTREGWPAIMYEIDLCFGGMFPVKAFMYTDNQSNSDTTFTLTGKYISTAGAHKHDLFNVSLKEWNKLVVKPGYLCENKHLKKK